RRSRAFSHRAAARLAAPLRHDRRRTVESEWPPRRLPTPRAMAPVRLGRAAIGIEGTVGSRDQPASRLPKALQCAAADPRSKRTAGWEPQSWFAANNAGGSQPPPAPGTLEAQEEQEKW